MKKIILAAALFIGLSAFTAVQAQDTTTNRSKSRSGTTTKNNHPAKKAKKNTRRNPTDSTGTYGTMNNRRRDSL
jgi:hypothetical protein